MNISKKYGQRIIKCHHCMDSGKVNYYHDAGDHFGGGTAPNSEWREKPCPKCQKED
jgi:hypothetical protein